MSRILAALCLCCCATPLKGPAHSLLRVHLDVAKPGRLPALERVREEYLQWVQQHAKAPGESPVFFLRVGDDQLWAVRPAATWNDIPAQGERDTQTALQVEAAVPSAQHRANDAAMHGNIVGHHNELLRLEPALSTGEGALTQLLPTLAWVVVDDVVPADTDAYEGALRNAKGAGWRLVYFSSPGTGKYVLFAAALEGLPDQRSLISRQALPARWLPQLGSSPSP